MFYLIADELLLYICYYLDLHGITNLSKACKLFYRITRTESLWMELYNREEVNNVKINKFDWSSTSYYKKVMEASLIGFAYKDQNSKKAVAMASSQWKTFRINKAMDSSYKWSIRITSRIKGNAVIGFVPWNDVNWDTCLGIGSGYGLAFNGQCIHLNNLRSLRRNDHTFERENYNDGDIVSLFYDHENGIIYVQINERTRHAMVHGIHPEDNFFPAASLSNASIQLIEFTSWKFSEL